MSHRRLFIRHPIHGCDFLLGRADASPFVNTGTLEFTPPRKNVSAPERNICSITCDTLHGSGIEKFGGDQSVRSCADGCERESGAFRHVE